MRKVSTKKTRDSEKKRKRIILSTLHDLVMNPFSCPTQLDKMNEGDFHEFMRHISLHKMNSLTYHLLECKRCRKNFTQDQLEAIRKKRAQKAVVESIFNSEVNDINKCFKQNKIRGYLYKDTGWLETYTGTPLFQTSYDVDILVSFKDFKRTSEALQKNGWSLKKIVEEFSRLFDYHWQQHVFLRSGKEFIEVDLQWGVGQAKGGIFSHFKTGNMIKLVSSTLGRSKKFGLLLPPKHTQLIYAIIHFFYHDKCFGSRHLLEIKEIAMSLNTKEWGKCIALAQRHHLEKVFWLVLFMTEKIFSIKIVPDRLTSKLSLKEQMISKIYPALRTQYKPSDSNLKQLTITGWSSILRALIAG